MSAEPKDPGPSVTANVELGVGDWRLEARLTVPAGPTSLRVVLPVIQSLADGMVNLAVKATESKGETISCKKGCGACCRQLVPISEVEARRIRDLVEEMPEPRRSEVRARFAEARRRLEEAGLLEKLQQREEWSEEFFPKIGLDYFYQGIACPFLEEESCSIHPDRPITCREYLVTSPAENCSDPPAETIRWVGLPAKVWTALARFTPIPAGSPYIRWVPLVLAPDWAEEHPEELPDRPGPEWMQELLERLTGSKASSAASPVLPTS
jgi:Fe-S-cluster containining protein